MSLSSEKQNRFRSRLKQTMLTKLQTLIDSYVKNSKVATLLRVFSGDELRKSFEKKWQMFSISSLLSVVAKGIME